jgi:uncharacterized membrane protein YdjX (TVP38/TMEM64 family)
MRRPLFLAVLAVVIAFAGGRLLRAHLGIEISAASIQTWVAQLGWAAPAIYLGLVVFRHFLFIPSTIILPVGGLCFGAWIGTGLGALGIALCGLGQFTLIRFLRPRWVLQQVDRTVWGFEHIIERAGPWLVALVTAHPAAPMSPVHLAAGLSPLSAGMFILSLSIGALVRAFILAFFGSALLDPGSPRFYLATLLLLAAFTGPLLHPGLRRRIFGSAVEAETDPPPAEP